METKANFFVSYTKSKWQIPDFATAMEEGGVYLDNGFFFGYYSPSPFKLEEEVWMQ
jgi:hypothetical protein